MLLVALTLAATTQIQQNWNDVPNQHWIGKDWHANRLQDWQVKDSEVLCTEVSQRLPMRTLHFLTATIDGDFNITVTTAPIEHESEQKKNAWSGFLLGVGSDDIDYRLSALVHHVPAKDGGVIAGVDHECMVFLRRNDIPVGGNALWSINTKIKPDDLPLIHPTSTIRRSESVQNNEAVVLNVKHKGDQLILTATNPKTGRVYSRSTYDASSLDTLGGIALVSHHGLAGYSFDDFSLSGSGVIHHKQRCFGPVLSSLYTVSENVLNMTAQFPPLDGPRNAMLRIGNQELSVSIDTESWTASFRISEWDTSKDMSYALFLEGDQTPYEGLIRKEPSAEMPIKVAALTCHKTYTGNLQWNENGLWFPQADIVAAVNAQDPDLLYFSGDQIYEGDLTPARQKNEDAYILDYLYKWTHWCWAFGDLTRNRPCITIPDDHDVYHGNLWGAGERDAQKVEGLTAQDSGGYRHSPRFVNAVHRTQTSHLPTPVDPAFDAQGNSVYFTRLRYGGLDIAILGDRQFKESPAIACPEGEVYNGWFKAEGFDPKTQSDKDVPLLGSRQEQFLDSWSTDWQEGDWMKFVFSQSPFVCLQTLPQGTFGGQQAGLPVFPVGEKAPNDVPVADGDSNGWPQSGRNRAVRLLKKANAIHVCGDQHLGSVVQYGIEEHGDGTFVFCTPAIANTWPRRWMPKDKPILGNHEDGFGNLMTVFAVSNPHVSGHEPAALHDRVPGWGLLVCDPATESVTINAWPRWAEPNAPASDQYEGWPIFVEQAGKPKE